MSDFNSNQNNVEIAKDLLQVSLVSFLLGAICVLHYTVSSVIPWAIWVASLCFFVSGYVLYMKARGLKLW